MIELGKNDAFRAYKLKESLIAEDGAVAFEDEQVLEIIRFTKKSFPKMHFAQFREKALDFCPYVSKVALGIKEITTQNGIHFHICFDGGNGETLDLDGYSDDFYLSFD